MLKKHIIIGTSAAGIGAAQKLRQLDQKSEILCISDEAQMPYNKCFLADCLAGRKNRDEVYTKKNDFFEKNNIQLLLNSTVVAIEPVQKNIILADNSIYFYDTLFLGIGKKTPQILKEQDEVHGIFAFHSLASLLVIENYLINNNVQEVVIIGAGLTGLECADALQKYHVNIHIIDMHDQVLASQSDADSAKMMQDVLEKHSVTVHLQTSIQHVMSNNAIVQAIELTNGTKITTQMIIVAAGARINTQLAQNAGIIVDPATKAIITNEYLQTNYDTIYAGGDAILVYDTLLKKKVPNCLWPDAMLQGITAAHTMAGQKKVYGGTAMIASTSFFGINFASCGSINHIPEHYQVIIKQNSDFYYKYVLFEQKLQGFLMVGSSFNLSLLKRAVLTQETINTDMLP